MIYIFSDESGDVYDPKEPYYVRSFVFIEKKEYADLETVLEKIKTDVELKELKFKNFKGNEVVYKKIFDFDFYVYVAFTNIRDDFLSETHPYYFKEGFLEYLQEWKNTFYEQFTDLLEKKVSSAVDYVFWLEYYEKYYILNSREILSDIYKIDIFQSDKYQYFFDKPKFNEQDYIRIVRNFYNEEDYDVKKERINIVQDSSTEAGIQIADIFAGSIRDILMNGEINSHYNDYIFPRLLSGTNAKYMKRRNPCRIQMGGGREDFLPNEIKVKLY